MAQVATHTIDINGKAFRVRIGWNAVRRLEEILRIPITVLGAKMLGGDCGLMELGLVFWAGLETARIHDKSRPEPYSVEEVGNMIDDFGADAFFDIVYPQLLVALTEAFPSVKKKAESGEGPLAEALAGIGTDSSATPQTTA